MYLNNNLFSTMIYFLVFLYIGSMVIPLVGPINDSLIHFSSTSSEIRDHFGGMDPGSFATGGWTIFKDGWFDWKTVWLINLWPPGLMILEGVILKLFGEAAPLAGILQVIAALILAIAWNLFRLCLELFLSRKIAISLTLVILAFPQFRIFMLGADAVLLGGTFAISFLLSGFFLLILSYARRSFKLAIFSGVCFALSAYFRSQFETFFMVATINICLVALIFYVYNKIYFRYFKLNVSNDFKLINPFLIIILSIITFHALTIPYRLYTHSRMQSYKWVQTEDIIWQHNFTSSNDLDKNSGGFVRVGGGNLACIIDSDKCKQIKSKLDNHTITSPDLRKSVILTFLQNPVTWIKLKFQILPKYWFITINSFGALSRVDNISSLLENMFFLGCILFTLLYSFITLKNPYSLINYWMSSSLCIAYSIIFIFAHFEVRYFFVLKFYFAVAAMLCFAQIISRLSSFKSTVVVNSELPDAI